MIKIVIFITKHTSGVVYKVLRFFYRAFLQLCLLAQTCLYYLFRIFPLQDKVVASTFRGKRYGDNPQFIVERLHEIDPEIQIVWITQKGYDYSVPEYIKTVDYYSKIKKIYAYATAKVWINTHRMEQCMRKRKKQLFIETWHGGLGIKKIELDCEEQLQRWELKELRNTAKMADLFISNSDHLTKIYRQAFRYPGVVWKCGYPKNDILVRGSETAGESVRSRYNIPGDAKILLYAPTFRANVNSAELHTTVYAVDFVRLKHTLEANWGGSWRILVRWHPIMKDFDVEARESGILDATGYPDMQELILASDAFLSDYSSCIFDAALRGIPCLSFAVDFEAYKKDRGVYYEMEELPFPYAKNNEELMHSIESFDPAEYAEKWDAFKARTGFHETGHAAADIAEVISAFVRGNAKPLHEIQSE